MAMIECTECGAQISDKAPACVKCGAPVAGVAPEAAAPVVVTKVVVTEQTGKVYKMVQLAGVAMICLGVVSCVGHNVAASSTLFLLGLVTYLGGRAAAWWNHG